MDYEQETPLIAKQLHDKWRASGSDLTFRDWLMDLLYTLDPDEVPFLDSIPRHSGAFHNWTTDEMDIAPSPDETPFMTAYRRDKTKFGR